MSEEEQEERLVKMQAKLKKYTVKHWASTFMKEQMNLKASKEVIKTRLLNEAQTTDLIEAYQSAKKRLIFLDYDGTLMVFQDVRQHP